MGTYEVQGQDGKTYQFNAADDNAAAASIDELYTTQGWQPPEQTRQQFATAFDPSQDRPEMATGIDTALANEDVNGAVGTFGNSLLMGAGDEIMGLIGGGLAVAHGKPFEEGYDRMATSVRDRERLYASRHPIASTALQVAGALPTALVPGGAAVRGASLAGKVARGIATGAAYGGAAGYAQGEGGIQDRVESAATGAALGGAVGGAAPVAGRVAGNIAGRVAGRRAVPSVEATKKAADTFLNFARQSGVEFQPGALQRLAGVRGAINPSAKMPRLRPQIHANAIEALDIVDEMARQPSVSFGDLMTTRQVLRDTVRAAQRGSPDEREAMRVLDAFDNWADNLKPRDMTAGNLTGREAFRVFREGNQLWSQFRKGETIADMINVADLDRNTPAGFAGSLRNQFKTLAKNKNTMKTFTKDEQDAIRQVAKGGPVRWIMSTLSRFLPDVGTGTLASAITGNPAPIGAAAAKAAARAGANRSVTRAATRADEVIRSGGKIPFNRNAASRIGGYAAGLTGTGGEAAVPALTPGAPRPLDLGDINVPANAAQVDAERTTRGLGPIWADR